MDRMRAQQILRTVLDRVQIAAASPVDNRLVGTGAALLQGVSLPVGDLDILVAQRCDVDRCAAALADFACLHPPHWLAGAQQYYAEFVVSGERVGFSTVEWPTPFATVECAGSGPWQHWVPVTVGDHEVRAVRLELRLVSELLRERPDRYEPLLDHLIGTGLDDALLLQAMADREVPEPLREHVTRRITGHRRTHISQVPG
ncbi:hypothetical protein [Actinoplanes sp. TFC3]|uniref:hypothetical protein n=1 Tax=Actinoplanes sp. TFC3 TaxID=1710355 RepID=UPI0013795B4C|nr:hypothetical protein [Actinoplanes sp. TFC3]